MHGSAPTNDDALLETFGETLYERNRLDLTAAQLFAQIDMAQMQSWAALLELETGPPKRPVATRIAGYQHPSVDAPQPRDDQRLWN